MGQLLEPAPAIETAVDKSEEQSYKPNSVLLREITINSRNKACNVFVFDNATLEEETAESDDALASRMVVIKNE